MKIKSLLLSLALLLTSSFLVAGCSAGGELLKQSLQKTAPKISSEDFVDSFAPVKSEFIEPYGLVLTTQSGAPLYTYNTDSNQTSNCYGECAIVWPPLTVSFAEDVGGLYGVVERADSSLQVTLQGKPLYTYAPDGPHKVAGDQKDDLWNVVVISE